jgi:hypothetical protein
MEAVRFNAGLPVYENAHATHIYGPLLTIFLAGIFRVTGLNLLAGRIAFSILAFALAFWLSSILSPSRRYRFVAFVLFLAINLRTNLIFLSAQPDCAAAFLATVGLYLWARRENSRPQSVCAIVFFLCSTFLKQTGAAFALVPIVYSFVWKRRLQDVATSSLPAMAIVLMLGALRLFWPPVFFGMVTVPASIAVNYRQILPIGAYLIATFPIFLFALLARFLSREAIDERERWVLSAVAILVPVSIWTTCKSGGGYSSLLFGYLAATALFVTQLDRIWQWIRSLRGWRSNLTATAVAMAILLSFLIQFDRDLTLLFLRCGDEKYPAAVAQAQRTHERVISPQDPTIAYRGNGYFGRSLFFELDTHAVNGNWPGEIPESAQQELAQAKYVIEVATYVPTPMFKDALAKSHFQPMDVGALRGSAYTLWIKQSE